MKRTKEQSGRLKSAKEFRRLDQMGYSCLRIFEQNGSQSNGLPTLSGSAIPLINETVEINNISISISPEQVTKTIKGDNRTKQDKIVTGYNGTITFYGISDAALAKITANRIDTNGLVLFRRVAGGNPTVTLFCQVEGEKGDKANLWLLDCEFDNPTIEHGQEEDNPKSMSMNFFVSNRTVVGDELFFIKVPSTAAAYVAPGTEPTTSNLPVPVAAS